MAEPLSLILLSGCFDRVHYALALASAAAALERPVTLFVTLGALRALRAADHEGRPGWARLPVTPDLATAGCADGAALDARNRARGVAGFEELLEACTSLGVRFVVCEMGLGALGLTDAPLRPDLPIQRGGLASLLAGPGQIVVI